jgi:hypothetical protein
VSERRYRLESQILLSGSKYGGLVGREDLGPRSTVYGTVVALVEDTYPGAAKVRTEGGTGPLYVVNVGSVFKEAYEVLCAESQLQSRPEEPGPL